MQVSQAVEEYSYAILDLSPHTQRWYVEKLEVFVEWCEEQHILLENIRVADIRAFIEAVRKRTNPHTGRPLSTYTVHGYAQVVKGFFNFCINEDRLEELVSDKLPKRIKMPRVEQKIIETFSQEQIKGLFVACEREITSDLVIRDKAILSVLLDTGIRAGELIGLTLNHVHLSPQNAYIKVFGKGMKWREVGLGKEARTALHTYIALYRCAPPAEQHVFLSRRTGGPLTVDGLNQILYRLRDWADIKGVRCSAHTFRHTYAVSFLSAGGDIYTLSRLLGHTSVQVTENYLRAFKAREARKNGISILDQM